MSTGKSPDVYMMDVIFGNSQIVYGDKFYNQVEWSYQGIQFWEQNGKKQRLIGMSFLPALQNLFWDQL